jgi:hypothetical protein
MSEPDWKDLKNWPKDAKLLVLVDGGFFCKWVDDIEYNFFIKNNYWKMADIQYEESEYNSEPWDCKYRPGPWAEGEERIENIVRNSGEGEHYDELPELDEFLGTEAGVVDPVMSVEGYDCLRDVLIRAYDQAAKGKGDERHAQGSAFEDQPMQKTIDLYGVGFALGQSAKKAQESMRLPKDRAIAELLGGINYLAGAIINMEKSK